MIAITTLITVTMFMQRTIGAFVMAETMSTLII